MDTTTPNAARSEEKQRSGTRASPSPFEALNASELFWQPYRSMSRALLQTHQNLSAYIAVNRSLADEMQALLRRAQDMVVEMSDLACRHLSDSAESRGALTSAQMEDMYDFAVASVRELGGAAVAAQIRSLETLRDHARNTLKTADGDRSA